MNQQENQSTRANQEHIIKGLRQTQPNYKPPLNINFDHKTVLDCIKKGAANQLAMMNKITGFFLSEIKTQKRSFCRLIEEKEKQISDLRIFAREKFSDLVTLVGLKAEANFQLTEYAKKVKAKCSNYKSEYFRLRTKMDKLRESLANLNDMNAVRGQNFKSLEYIQSEKIHKSG